MLIRLNGAPREIEAATLAAALEELGYAGAAVATALNGAFVARGDRAGAALQPGDAVEIVAPRQGG